VKQKVTLSAHPALVTYPAKASFGRVLPKAKIYEHGCATARIRDLFVKQVEQIVWQFKLAPETVNLQARRGVPEIQVFAVHLKQPELHTDVLRAIDDAIPFPILFELSYADRTQVIATYKRPSEADASRWVLSEYFGTDWLPSDAPRTEMPVALHMGGLYEQLLHRLIPLKPRLQEGISELVDRLEQFRAKQRDLEKATVRLEKEIQFNRKVEINASLRTLKSELDALSR
jgi:Domain of unknown function (DUF4391)